MIEFLQNVMIGAALLFGFYWFLAMLAFLVKRAPVFLLLGLATLVGYGARAAL